MKIKLVLAALAAFCSLPALPVFASGASASNQDAPPPPPPSASLMPPPYVDTTAHTEHSVVANGIRLSYLDFGGKGPDMVFLPGLDDTGHIFDGIAPGFTTRYHVYALTRRGCGDSQKPAPSPDGANYSTAVLTADVLAFMDKVGMQKAVIIGHSLSGNTMTLFAAKHPSRVSKLVYLDGAYDLHGSLFGRVAGMSVSQVALVPGVSTPASALKSIDAYRKYCQQLSDGVWNTASENNMRDKIVVGADGAVTEKCSPQIAAALLLGGVNAHPVESAVKTPAICLFAKISTPSQAQIAAMGAQPSQKQAFEKQMGATVAWQKAMIDAAASKMHAKVIVFPADTSHYLFIQYPDKVESDIWEFLEAK